MLLACNDCCGPPSVPTPSCGCATTPLVLTMTRSNSLNGDVFQDCTFTYGATPAAFSGAVGANSFVGPLLTDTSGAGDFYPLIHCTTGLYILSNGYTNYFGGGSTLFSPTRYRWSPLTSGNTCTPFHFANGTVFSGGQPVNLTLTG